MNPPNKPDPTALTSRPTTRVVALVAASADDLDDDARSTEWEVLRVTRGAGASSDTAQLFRRLDRQGRMKNRSISDLRLLKVEIWTRGEDGELDQPLFWGQMDTRQMSLMPGGEAESGIAAVRPFHFGSPLRGMQVWDENTSDVITVEMDAEFNPLYDGVVTDNMRRQVVGGPEYKLWWMPESTRTTLAYEQHGSLVSPSPWDLRSIVETLCGWLNTDETYVLNYRGSEDETVDDFADAPAIKNARLRRGQYLPQLLDAILQPYGYNWYLAPEKTNGRITPRITVFQRGKGPKKKLYFPAIDSTANNTHTADKIDLVADLYQLANQVRCEGGLKQYEVTIPLYRAWAEADDSTGMEDLTKNANGADAFGPIWRKWVANEAGDYSDTRVSVHPIPTAPPDFDGVFGSGNWVIRRRRLMPCLTWEDAERTRRKPVRVQYSTNSGTSWTDADPSWGVRILQDEIGIMFTANEPPEELYNAGSAARVRVTGTIEGDVRLVHTATRQTDNPQANTVELVLDVSDQFQFRYRQTPDDGAFYSSYYLEASVDEVDDSSAIQTFAETVRSQREAVMLQASIGTFGINLEYQIGDIITDITGREIKLNRLPQEGDDRFLQIIGIDHNVAGQTTRLIVSPYDR